MATKTLNDIAPEPYYSRGLRKQFRLGALISTDDEKASLPAANAQYEVDETKYHALVEKRLRAGGLEKDVPAGWPKAVRGPLVWKGADFDYESEYVLRLSNHDKNEIQHALRFFNEQGFDGDQVNRDVFPLPTLGKTLERAAEDVYNGRGFVIVRGLDPDIFSVEDSTTIYLGLSSYIAERRGMQDQRGSMLMHVMKKDSDGERNIDNLDKPFHTDTVCDCLCLFTRSCSVQGGASILASAWTVYNELAATRPDLIHVLAKPDWPFDTFGRDPPYYKRAIMYCQDDKVIINFSRRLLVGHPPEDPRTNGIPGLNEAQAEALDAVHLVARKYEMRPRMEKGDIRFVNNMAVLHRREAFEDDPDTKRHLIRLWLNNEEMCWKLPRPLRLAWARVFDDPERKNYWDIVPPRNEGVLLRVAGSCD